MNTDVFVDTNVLLYTIDEDPGSAPKRQRANELMDGLAYAAGYEDVRSYPHAGPMVTRSVSEGRNQTSLAYAAGFGGLPCLRGGFRWMALLTRRR